MGNSPGRLICMKRLSRTHLYDIDFTVSIRANIFFLSSELKGMMYIPGMAFIEIFGKISVWKIISFLRIKYGAR
jgi:hypothetical protein